MNPPTAAGSGLVHPNPGCCSYCHRECLHRNPLGVCADCARFHPDPDDLDRMRSTAFDDPAGVARSLDDDPYEMIS